jgi:DNA primase
MKQCIEKIRDSLLASSIISRKVILKPKGTGRFLGLCPFHSEKTPSFTVSDEKGFYHCFGCGAHGDVFTFVSQTEGLSFKDTVERLAQECGVELPKYSPKQIEQEQHELSFYELFELTTTYYEEQLNTPEGRKALDYLKRRGLKPEIIKQFRLGYAPLNHSELRTKVLHKFSDEEIIESSVLMKGQTGGLYNLFRGRVIFPIMNRKNRIIAFGGRILGEGEPKYFNSPENPIFKKGDELYGLNFASRDAFKTRELILVEGYMDVISMANYGINNAVAPLGTAVKTKQIELLWKYSDEPTICMDSDNAGRKSMAKIATEAMKLLTSGKSLKFCMLEGGKDPDEVLSKHGLQYFYTHIKHAKSLSDLLFEIEQSSKKIDTPEKRLDLRDRLVKLASEIKNPEISKGYRFYFLEKFSSLFFKKNSKKAKQMNQESVVASTLSKNMELASIAIQTVIQNPDLLNENQLFDELMKLEISTKELDKIRNSLLSITELSDSSLRETAIARLKQEYAALPQLRSHTDDVGLNWGFTRGVSYDDIRDGLLRLFKIITLKNIQEEISTTKNELMSTPHENIFRRLAELKRHEEELKQELEVQ